ncbi:hypothetical protein [Methylobacterium terricola]|uniref:hypothetical protein n=1 Tax=Methylobacterium terricola TaxID=2583531 RepID=UPI0014867DEC|nr:hypothetical protein [Methylobacterium terricola]
MPPVPGGPAVGLPPIHTPGVVPGTELLLGLPGRLVVGREAGGFVPVPGPGAPTASLGGGTRAV